MRPNSLRSLWKSGAAAVNGWPAIANSFSAETMARRGWDALTIDLQHGVIDYPAMVTMLQAISTTPTVPVVRVPWLEPGIHNGSFEAGLRAKGQRAGCRLHRRTGVRRRGRRQGRVADHRVWR